ncbi:hypothetical protein KAR91_66415 [Candidatus Pacearchaeota archaeon]|nr:hypothetical protein [Candidatus Pacearchaeota archaeon]
MKIYFRIKRFFILTFTKSVKTYNEDNLNELKGTELQYVSNDLCMTVYIAEIDIKKGITLMGRWWDKHDRKYEDKDSVIFCINRERNDYEDDEFLKKINQAIQSGVWTYKHRPSYWGGNVDNNCAFR